jgi:hypothetical protein
MPRCLIVLDTEDVGIDALVLVYELLEFHLFSFAQMTLAFDMLISFASLLTVLT